MSEDAPPGPDQRTPDVVGNADALKGYLAMVIGLASKSRNFRELQRHVRGDVGSFLYENPISGTHTWRIDQLKIKQQTGTETMYEVHLKRVDPPGSLITLVSVPR